MTNFKPEHTIKGNPEYLDKKQVNQSKSYYIESRPTKYGDRYVYQYITMLDGTVYELSSITTNTKGILASRFKQVYVLQKEVKALTKKSTVIPY